MTAYQFRMRLFNGAMQLLGLNIRTREDSRASKAGIKLQAPNRLERKLTPGAGLREDQRPQACIGSRWLARRQLRLARSGRMIVVRTNGTYAYARI